MALAGTGGTGSGVAGAGAGGVSGGFGTCDPGIADSSCDSDGESNNVSGVTVVEELNASTTD